ncbi:MAG: hypothetical protein ABIG71_04115 [Candidatus Uhrbacteria bacterium]
MRFVLAVVIALLALLGIACPAGPTDVEFLGDDGTPRRGTISTGVDATQARGEIYREDGTIDNIVEDELFMAAGNRSLIYLTIINDSDGWWPYNIELCIDNQDLLRMVDPNAFPQDEVVEYVDDPCVVYFDSGAWPIIGVGQEFEPRIGTVEALPQAGGGYLLAILRLEMPDGSQLDIVEYTIPYRTLP